MAPIIDIGGEVDVPAGNCLHVVAYRENVSMGREGTCALKLSNHVITLCARSPLQVGRLAAEWREVRRNFPALFYSGSREGCETTWASGQVRLWFAPKATEDAVVACWLSDLAHEEGARGSSTVVLPAVMSIRVDILHESKSR